jgi:PAS domain S-box-containing protein
MPGPTGTHDRAAEAKAAMALKGKKPEPDRLSEDADPYRVFFESADQGFCTIELKFDARGRATDYRFLEVNPAFEANTGLSDAAGKWMRELHPEHEDIWFETYGQVALSGKPARFEAWAEQLGRYYDVFAFGVGRPEQRKVGVLFRDVTAQKQMEGDLRQQRAELQHLFDSAPLGIYLVDDTLKVVAVNRVAAPAFGDIPDLIGMSLEDVAQRLFEPAFARDYCGHFRRVLQTGEPFAEAERIEKRRDLGVEECYEWRLSRIPLSNGRFGVVCYFRDISADVHSRAALADSHRKKDEFIATLSHELRNPLFAIRNGVEMLWHVCAGQSDAAGTIHMLERQVDQIRQLMDDLLDISRLSRGAIVLNKRLVNLGSVVQGAVEAVEHVAAESGHELNVEIDPRPVALLVDPTRISQVVGNLLSNAFKFTPKGGKIRLTGAHEGSDAVIRVSDTGIGIAESELPRIFDMFSQVHTALEGGQSGLGIGLTLVRNLVELHGGTVEAQSAGPGRGSVFTVRLPAQDVAMPAEEAPAPRKAASVVTPNRILVVDDNRDAADTLSALLMIAGHEVHTAYDGVQGVESALRLQPDVVFMDIGMPRLNGYEAARQLRQDARTRDILLVAVTGYGQEADRQRAREAGFDEHLVKPATGDDVARVLAKNRPARH